MAIERIGRDPAFPVSAADLDLHNTYSGLTVRQWMIGQVAAGWGWTDMDLPPSDPGIIYRAHELNEIIRIADCLLDREERKR